MRYQQKQREEMERKRNEFISSRGGIPGFDLNESNKIQIGNGKVSFSQGYVCSPLCGWYPYQQITSPFPLNISLERYTVHHYFVC